MRGASGTPFRQMIALAVRAIVPIKIPYTITIAGQDALRF